MALAVLALATIAAMVAFMTLGAKGNWDFVLPFRGGKLLGLVLVAIAVATATVLFQTITQNRILTPAVMGFDSLFIALQTALVFFLGTRDLANVDIRLRFFFETVLMVGMSMALFHWLFLSRRRSLHLVVLAGLVFGVFFRSLSYMMQRILDPNEFTALQDMLFASFNSIDTQLLVVSSIIVLAAGWLSHRLLARLDVLMLGRDAAINLGIDYQRVVMMLFAVIAVLVSVSTALVGPVTFFGLLVASLAYQAVGTDRHKYTLPAAALIAIIALVGGQTVMERVFGFDTALSIIIEFTGGIAFMLLLYRNLNR
ncbi:iron chelate uptake ABC transporter family permease subunit [Nitratireductor kimnyeongensis]|uniref:Iron chelate uptake ABC transporter family permease subunit n=1 Tax=Nitratireductor kimnyeongensis TaxID=430679 RepID=A0ABW0T6J2_9HYPH|nr:iron chelate uptake ABC transporter family permease subunit [Nitratireductor kimnyeongensis]QZZ34462.1 iron chelate uptake ABC transporter family permease subunit [Nitratireductor kimnyeongensis]